MQGIHVMVSYEASDSKVVFGQGPQLPEHSADEKGVRECCAPQIIRLCAERR